MRKKKDAINNAARENQNGRGPNSQSATRTSDDIITVRVVSARQVLIAFYIQRTAANPIKTQ